MIHDRIFVRNNDIYNKMPNKYCFVRKFQAAGPIVAWLHIKIHDRILSLNKLTILLIVVAKGVFFLFLFSKPAFSYQN